MEDRSKEQIEQEIVDYLKSEEAQGKDISVILQKLHDIIGDNQEILKEFEEGLTETLEEFSKDIESIVPKIGDEDLSKYLDNFDTDLGAIYANTNSLISIDNKLGKLANNNELSDEDIAELAEKLAPKWLPKVEEDIEAVKTNVTSLPVIQDTISKIEQILEQSSALEPVDSKTESTDTTNPIESKKTDKRDNETPPALPTSKDKNDKKTPVETKQEKKRKDETLLKILKQIEKNTRIASPEGGSSSGRNETEEKEKKSRKPNIFSKAFAATGNVGKALAYSPIGLYYTGLFKAAKGIGQLGLGAAKIGAKTIGATASIGASAVKGAYSGVKALASAGRIKDGMRFNEKTGRYYNEKTGRMVSAKDALNPSLKETFKEKSVGLLAGAKSLFSKNSIETKDEVSPKKTFKEKISEKFQGIKLALGFGPKPAAEATGNNASKSSLEAENENAEIQKNQLDLLKKIEKNTAEAIGKKSSDDKDKKGGSLLDWFKDSPIMKIFGMFGGALTMLMSPFKMLGETVSSLFGVLGKFGSMVGGLLGKGASLAAGAVKAAAPMAGKALSAAGKAAGPAAAVAAAGAAGYAVGDWARNTDIGNSLGLGDKAIAFGNGAGSKLYDKLHEGDDKKQDADNNDFLKKKLQSRIEKGEAMSADTKARAKALGLDVSKVKTLDPAAISPSPANSTKIANKAEALSSATTNNTVLNEKKEDKKTSAIVNAPNKTTVVNNNGGSSGGNSMVSINNESSFRRFLDNRMVFGV